MKNFDAAIERKIKTFVAELQALVQQAAVEAVSEALGVSKPPKAAQTPKKAPKSGPRAAKKKGRKGASKPGSPHKSPTRRSPKQLATVTSKLQKHIDENPGHTIEEIRKALGMSTRELRLPVANLLKSGVVRKTGVKRQTKYYPASKKASAPKSVKAKTRSKVTKKR